ncbi:MAG: tetratricopeptide repeat protein [Planctomycetes bacterium]|nr:tetratricopeptide repeat protein [Planctomycetota bacterium]
MNDTQQGPVSVWLERCLARAWPGVLLFMMLGVVPALGALDAKLFLSYDDNWITTQNPLVVHGWGYFWTQLFLPFGKIPTAGLETAHWSPLALLSTALDHALFGGKGAGADSFAPWAMRGMSGIYHGLCAWLVLKFGLRLTRRFELALGAALIFLFHPTDCESVCWIIERNNVLPALFGLWALYVYTGADAETWTWEFPGEPAQAAAPQEPGFLEPSWPRVGATFLLLLCAQLCKASGVSWWPVLVACDFLLLRHAPWPRRAARGAILFLPVLLTLYVTGKSHSDYLMPPIWTGGLNPLFATAYLYVRYLGLCLFPVNLSAFYHVPASGPVWGVILGGWAGILAFFYAAWKLGVPWRRLVFYAVWFAAGLAPVLNPVATTSWLIQDRYLYASLPAFGFLLVEVAWALLAKFRARSDNLLIPVAALAAVLLALAVSRSCDWQDEIQLFADAAYKQPQTAFGHVYLASRLFHSSREERDDVRRQEMLDLALKAHARATQCDDYDRLLWALHYRNEFASLLLTSGHRREARRQFEEVWNAPREERILERGAKLYALKFLATDDFAQGRSDEALALLEKGLQLAPDDPELLHNRLRGWLDSGQKEKARAEAQRLLNHPVLGHEARKLLDALQSGAAPGQAGAP